MASRDRRILVVGVGNVLHGDDGFGVEVAWRLAKEELPGGVKVMETGIGGMSIIQELMQGYDAALVIDAHESGDEPGVLRLDELVLPDLSGLDAHELRDYFADTHYATPMRALAFAQRIGKLPPHVRVLGCEPESHAALFMGLSKPVTSAIDEAVAIAMAWIWQCREAIDVG